MTTATTEPATEPTTDRKQRASHLRWIRIDDLYPSPLAQREFRPSWAKELAAKFNLEGMGFPVVNHREDHFYIIDGQHRIAALRELGFEKDTIQCEMYEGLSIEEECEMFLERNTRKAVPAGDRFKVAVNAGREDEAAIDRAVRLQGLHTSSQRGNGGISAVSTLGKVYRRQGAAGLGKMLRVVRDAFGDAGYDQWVMDGVSLCLHRYDGQINEEELARKLGDIAGGVNGLLGAAYKLRAQIGQPKSQCVAATVADIYNRGRGGKKLAPWWRE